MVALLVGRELAPWPFAHATVYYVIALTGWGFSGIVAAGLGTLAAAAFLVGLSWVGARSVERIGLAGAVACTGALAVAETCTGSH